MIPRILWHMGGGILKRKLNKPVPGALLHYPGVWKSRAGLWDCHFGPKLTENAYFRNMELAIWYGCGYVHCLLSLLRLLACGVVTAMYTE